jgi:hypothetical protein
MLQTSDKLVKATLSASNKFVSLDKEKANCLNWVDLTSRISVNGTLEYHHFGCVRGFGCNKLQSSLIIIYFRGTFPNGVQCLRIRVTSATTDWLTVKLIAVKTEEAAKKTS